MSGKNKKASSGATILLEELQIPKQNRDEWLKLTLLADGLTDEAFVTNLESRAKMTKEYKASAKQLGLLSRPGQKRPASNTDTERYPFKRPFNLAFRSDSVSTRGQGSFRGRGAPSGSFRGRGGNCQQGTWNQVPRGRGFQPSAAAGSASQSNQSWLYGGKQTSGKSKPSNSVTKGSGGGKTSTFRKSVGSTYSRSFGLRNYSTWVRSRISKFNSHVFQGIKRTILSNAKQKFSEKKSWPF